MEALTELCDIIEQNPNQFLDKLPWICQQCPQPKFLAAESVRVSPIHLNAILAVARIISRNVDTAENHGKFFVLDFFQAIPQSFNRSFWPHSITLESISAFYSSFLGYVSCLSLELGTKVVDLTEEAVMSCDESVRDPAISRAFLVALSRNFPSIEQSVGDKLIEILLHQFAVVNGGSDMWICGGDELNFGYSEGSKHVFTQKLASFDDESIESLEKQEIAFKLVTNILGKVKVDSKLHLQVRSIAKRRLQSMSVFLKVLLFLYVIPKSRSMGNLGPIEWLVRHNVSS